MVVKTGRYGRFLACSSYPKCKGVKPLSLGIPCPGDTCDGQLVEKQTRKGKVFYGCNRYPDCKFATWEKPVNQSCPQCKESLLYEKAGRSEQGSIYCRKCGYSPPAKQVA